MFELLIAVLFFTTTVRYAGENGSRRFAQLPEKRAQVVHEQFASSAIDWLIVFNMAVTATSAVLWVYLGSWRGAVVSLVALGLLVAARVIRPGARANVDGGFAERGLRPLLRRERSEQRERRQKQFGAVALTGYLLGQVAQAVAAKTEADWPLVLQAPATLLMLGGGLAFLWTTAWRFGDERPVESSQPTSPVR